MIKNLFYFISLLFFLFLFSCVNEEKKLEFIDVAHVNSKSIKNAPWGVQLNILQPHSGIYQGDWDSIALKKRIDTLINYATEMGVKWVRFSVNWSTIQNDDGRFMWGYMDQTISGLKENNIEIILCLHGGHRAFTRENSVRGNDELDAWSLMADTVSKRYGDEIVYWEIWNEPNGLWFWKPTPKASEYFELVRTASYVIKNNIPDAKILGGSLARLDLPFADSLVKLGITEYIDVFSMHPYGEFPEGIISPVKASVKAPYWYTKTDHSVYELQDLLESSGVPVWQSECGYPSGANSLGWRGNGPWGDTIQCKWLLRRFMTDMRFGSDVSIIFTMIDYSYSNPDRINYKGLLRRDTYQPKPAYYTFRNVAAVLNGNIEALTEIKDSIVEIVDKNSFSGIEPKNIMYMRLENETGEFLSYWLKWRMQEHIQKSAYVKMFVEGFENPVVVDLIKGNYRSVHVDEDGNMLLPLYDYPMLITERDNMKKLL